LRPMFSCFERLAAKKQLSSKWLAIICITPGETRHKVDFSHATSRSSNFDFDGDNARGAKPFVKEVVLGSDTDPLGEGSDFSVCQQCHSIDGCLPNDVLPSPAFQLMAASCDQSASSGCAWIGSESAFAQEV